jgi:hypothetical protein
MGQTNSTGVKALALSVLAAGKSVPRHISALPTYGTDHGTQEPNAVPACGLPHCAGCYDVGDGRRIHPPKSSEDWKEWLLKWEPKGHVQ